MVRAGPGDSWKCPGRFVRPLGRSGTCRGTRGEVRDGLFDCRGGPGRVRNSQGDPGRVGGPSGRSGTGRGNRCEVRGLSGDPREGPRQFVGPSRWCRMVCSTIGKVRDVSGDRQGGPGGLFNHWGGPGRVGEPSGRFGTGRRTLGEVWDGSEHPLGGPGRVVGPLGRSGTGRRTLGVVRNGSWTLEEVRDGTVDPQGGPGRVGVPQGSSGWFV